MSNTKMHDNELDIDQTLVADLLAQQFPKLKDLDIKQIKHSGTDNAIFRLGEYRCVRLPKIDSAAEQIEKEQELLPRLAPHLPLKIPTPIEKGKPTASYPFNWSIYNWLEGKNAHDEKVTDLDQTAIDLANFINSIQNISTDGAPITRRGLPLASKDEEVRKAIFSLKDMIDPNTITSIWEESLNRPNWKKAPVWLHGDLLPVNLLIQNGKLSAIIDFGLSGIGDPACDLIPAWNIFDANSRNSFRNTMDVDESTWIRGRGWALSIALTIIPYYRNTNPELVSIAKQILNEILADFSLPK